MAALTVLIIDDEQLSRETISEIVQQYCENAVVVGEAAGITDGLKAIKELNPDVILLDIQLEDGNGFELLRRIEPLQSAVIFITAYEEYAIKAFKTAAIDYLLKPLNVKEFQDALRKVTEQKQRAGIEAQLNILLTNFYQVSSGQNQKIVLKTSEQIHILAPNEIMHVEADGSYSTFFLVNKTKILVCKPIKDYEEILDKKYFVRIHQSHLVNMIYASRFEKRNGSSLILKDGTALPVSNRKKDDLIAHLEQM